MAGSPDLPPLYAAACSSSRKPALREASSAPWHLKQLPDRIGLTSRLKSTAPARAKAGATAIKPTNPMIALKGRNDEAVMVLFMRNILNIERGGTYATIRPAE